MITMESLFGPDVQKPRGLRNNNPLNIRRNPNEHWQGQKHSQTDPQFVQFQHMGWGWRAAFKLLRTYYYVHGLHTISQIISRWAPASDNNNTEAYIRKVCELTGMLPDETLRSPATCATDWLKLGIAMAIVENGTDVLDYFACLDGYALAER